MADDLEDFVSPYLLRRRRELSEVIKQQPKDDGRDLSPEDPQRDEWEGE